MRAVNLVPKDYRRGRLAGRSGEIFSYALIGGLVAVLLAVVAVVLTSNKVSDNKAELAKLQQQLDDAQTEASSLAPYTNFANLAQARIATVSSLAQSRFDWERVMRELSQTIPADVWLTKLSGTVVPDVTLDNAVSIASRSSITGPALEIEGCGSGQEAVAKFVAALEEIDGVTRVGVQSSDKTAQSSAGPTAAAGGAAAPSDTGGECATKDFIAKFQVVAAFDAAPVPATSADGTAAPAPATPAPATPTPTTPEASGAQQQQAAQQQSVQQAKDKAQKATHYIPGN